ncbi:MAG: hypothetical protein BGO97_00240 [Micrococcales bacterium 70-64]|nr:low temperature requirement protein A [Leifsonia sp.]ODU65662.1 MAG: hypothetical protein ABT06_00240 [Leifsonia sp. SCN 70-46]OJX84289.1 MAG: hypothetical protein BGO97_00240 [Micrococcales bacterium 70-64]
MPTSPVRSFLRLRTTDESHRVTTLELFFDLVFVFAFTQVTGFMAESHSAVGVLQGLVILAMLWWSWTSYSWLANQTRIDEGIARVGFCAAIVLLFIVSLAIPEAFDDREGGLFAPVVLVVAYLFIRLIHGFVYLAAAGDDAGLRRQLYRSVWPMALGVALMLAGTLVGGGWQVWFWLAGIGLDVMFTYFLSVGGGWRVQSAAHWAERYGLIVMLALGESIVEIGFGAAQEPLGAGILAASVLAVGLSIALWWMYFDIVSIGAEKYLAKLGGTDRADLASDAYTYLHFTLVAGVIISALGVENVLAHLDSEHGLELFGSVALFGGTSLYLAGHAFFWRRVAHRWLPSRLIGAAVLLALIPVGAALPSLAAIALATGVTAAVVAVETLTYSRERAAVRSGG